MKVWSEDGAGKVVEIPADMTARDVCQLLVYKSHCLDDNAWTLVEHHPILGLGEISALLCLHASRLRFAHVLAIDIVFSKKDESDFVDTGPCSLQKDDLTPW